MTVTSSRVRPTTPRSGATIAVEHADFACAYEITAGAGDVRSSQQWARAAWEGAPAPLRWFMAMGWRLVLGLRLGPGPSPDYILGWRIVEDRADKTECQSRSWFLNACNVFSIDDGRLVWSTLIVYERPIARVVWLPVSLLHRPLVRLTLRRVARSS
jgi:hypothetical protein